MKIKRAKNSDTKILGMLNKHLIEDEDHSNPMNQEQLSLRMKQWLEGEYTCYLAILADTIVAYCLFRDDGDHYYLRQLYVERQYRRKGIASEFLDWLYQNAWKDKKVRLEVLVHNENAISFYKKYGFEIDCLWMGK